MSASSASSAWAEGETILIRTAPDENHLFIVVTPPDPKSGVFLIAPLNTLRPHVLDRSCVLDPTEHPHPFLVAKSIVRYDLIKEATAQMLAKAELAKVAQLRPYPPFPVKTVRFIQERALHSEHIEERFEACIRRLLG